MLKICLISALSSIILIAVHNDFLTPHSDMSTPDHCLLMEEGMSRLKEYNQKHNDLPKDFPFKDKDRPHNRDKVLSDNIFYKFKGNQQDSFLVSP